MIGIIGQGYGVAAAIGNDGRFIIGQATDDLGGIISRSLLALRHDDRTRSGYVNGQDDAGHVEDQAVIFLQIRRKTDGRGIIYGKV